MAFAGWDVAGARWFGYPPVWVNRLELPVEELAVAPDGRGGTSQTCCASSAHHLRSAAGGLKRSFAPSETNTG